MNPASVHIAAPFFQVARAVTVSVWWRAAVAHVVTTDDKDVRLGTLGQNRRNAPQKGVNAAIRLQVACHIGHHFICNAQYLVASVRLQNDTGIEARAYGVGINAIVNLCNPPLPIGGITGFLPRSGGDAAIGRLKADQLGRVFYPHARNVVSAHRKLWVKAHVGSLRSVKEL